MSVEEQINVDNPRTDVSFFNTVVKQRFIASFNAERLWEHLQMPDESITEIFHELWRVGQERLLYEVVKKDKDLFVHHFMLNREFSKEVAYLYICEGEALENCENFFRDTLALVSKAVLEVPFEESLPEDKLSLTNNAAAAMLSWIKETKIEYYDHLSKLN